MKIRWQRDLRCIQNYFLRQVWRTDIQYSYIFYNTNFEGQVIFGPRTAEGDPSNLTSESASHHEIKLVKKNDT